MSVEENIRQLSPLQRALLAVKEMRARVEELERAQSEPIAIVGIGCRFPGSANGPEEYFQLLRSGVDAVREIPRERWDVDAFYSPDPEVPGKMNTRHGGFIDGVDLFDAPFFGISAREATSMDPQQRLLLHVAQEAFDDAGQPTDRLAGSQTGVFLGTSLSEYTWHSFRDRMGANCHTATGSFGAISANRISYTFDLRGPSFTVDAVCSASLLAVHLACQSLRRGECTAALAGGAGLSLTPDGIIWFSKLGATCAEGKCRAFDAGANGIVLAEAVAVVVLKPLERALADGDRVYAVIRGSAVAQDGRSNGLTAPTRHAQQAMLRAAYRDARVDPSRVHYVETHGTGTVLGDPIEASALGDVIGRGRSPDNPCLIGSVKTNLGHTQMVGGVAGLIKVALSMYHRELPASLHFERPNPHIDFEALRLEVRAEHGPWPSAEPAVAGVTSLSFGGTNVHVVMAEAPPQPAAPRPAAADRPLLLPLSARSAEALRAAAAGYRAFVEREGAPPLAEVCYSAALRRTHYEHRAAIAFRNREELSAALGAVAAGQRHPAASVGRRSSSRIAAKTVFVFSGQGSQWAKMGDRLLSTEPALRDAMARCDLALRAHVGWSVLEELSRPEAESRLGELDVIQTVLFAVQVGIAELWRSWGVVPAAVIGHSMGEVAAAHVAGALSLEDAARVISERSALIKTTCGQGAMALCALSMQEAERLLREAQGGDLLSVAAENGPCSVVLSGDAVTLARVVEELGERNVFARFIKSDAAGHCSIMDPLLGELVRRLAGITPRAAQIPICSPVTGTWIAGEEMGARYWARNMREPVRFASGVLRLLEEDHLRFVEIAPHPILLPSIEQCVAAPRQEAVAVASWLRGDDERGAMLRSLGALYAAGESITFERLHREGGRFVRLPRYPWQVKRYWLDVEDSGGAAAVRRVGESAEEPPSPAETPELVRRLAPLSPERRRGALMELLQVELTRVLGRDPEDRPGADDGFFALGMTSLQALELKRSLDAAVGRRLPSTLAFEYPTIRAAADYLFDELAIAEELAPPTITDPAAVPEEAAAEALSKLPEGQLCDLIDSELEAIEGMVG
jgi:acyl transferase domain-containing protein